MNNAAGLVGGAARPWPVMEAQHYPAQLTSRCQKRPTVRARSSARPLIDPGPSRVGGPVRLASVLSSSPNCAAAAVDPSSRRCQSSSLLRCASDPNLFSGAVAAHLSAFTSRSCFLLACTDGSLWTRRRGRRVRLAPCFDSVAIGGTRGVEVLGLLDCLVPFI